MTQTQQNISSRSAYTRFMLGSMMTAYGTVRLMRDSKSRSGQVLILLGSMKAAEGATRFCPRKAMGSSITNSNMMQKMKSDNASQGALAGASMNSATPSGENTPDNSNNKMSGNIMQMVGKIVQMLTVGNTSQSTEASAQNMGSTHSMSGASGQDTTSGNIAQTIGNMAQQMTNGTTSQTISKITQKVAPQVGQIMKDVASMTGSQTVSGTNNSGKQNSGTNGNTKKEASGNSNGTMNANSGASKSASASKHNENKQAASSNDNKEQKANTTNPNKGGSTANKSNLTNVESTAIKAASKTTDQNATSSNILQ
ncbi:DUF2892 domain-containing protein [Psychrobacillus glaciei]|uniref:DUF2892 domain-containing protein n=1 Tax=Psychrobacillus glaciei TaxID=2283160 RepID=A0A5J6SL93_9BACI|nr:DUF2892 domain-containing protein [Psychrobacillus glaciei]QFF98442.1 DUF2892 domain-containing protein [Psychrobacillus glaciei]